MSNRDEFVTRLKGQIDEWNAQIDDLQAAAKEASEEVRARYEEGLETLLARRDEALDKLTQLQESSEMAFEELRIGAEDVWQRTKDAFAAAGEWLSEG